MSLGLLDRLLAPLDRLRAKRFGVVEPGRVYRSGALVPGLIKRMLARHGIGLVIDMRAPDPADPQQRAEAEAVASLGIGARRFPLGGDGIGDITAYADAIAALHAAAETGTPVLVHCAAGSQRTGGVVAFYRLLVQRWPARRVLAELRRYNWDPARDRAMLDYMNDHMAELARLLVERGVIGAVPDPAPRLRP